MRAPLHHPAGIGPAPSHARLAPALALTLALTLTRSRAQVAKLFADSSTIALTSFISPYAADRASARALHASSGAAAASTSGDAPLPFIEVWVDISVAAAERRDPKGLYKKARAGEIKDFTGVSAPYEAPERAEIHIRSETTSVEQAVAQIVAYLREKGHIAV